MISYTPKTYSFVGHNYPSVDEATFAKMIANKEPVYEVIINDKKTKYYFDIDIYAEDTGCDFDKSLAETIEEKGKQYIIYAFSKITDVKPNIAVATSHGLNDEGKAKYSVRYFVSNLMDTKTNIKGFVKELNKYVLSKEDYQENIYEWIDPRSAKELKANPHKPLFDETIYDSNRKMRCINTSKPNEDRPLIMKEGKIEQTIITGCFDTDVVDLKCQIRPSSPNSVVSIEPSQKIETKDKYLELLFNVIGNGNHIDYKKWFKILCILKCNGYSFDTAEKYTAIVDKGNPKTKSIWDAINGNRPISIYALQNLAKESNFNGYFEWLDKYNEYITMEIVEKGVNEISKFISKSLKTILIYDNNTWYACKNNLWVKLKDPSAMIVSAIEDELDKYVKILTDKLNKIDKEDENAVTFARKQIKLVSETRSRVVNQMGQYAKLLTDYLWVSGFNENLDTNIYQIAFKDGIFDLRTGQFRLGLFPTDFITKTLPYNYEAPNESDISKVRNELKKICNYNDTHLAYYLSILGYALTGDAMRQQEFYYLRGQKAGNGKSVIFEALDDILPIYSMKMESDVFNENNSNRHKEIATWAGMRIAWANEIGLKKLDREFLKDVSDGTKIKYKPLYKDSEYMPINFKAFIVSNNTISFDSDEGIKRRLRLGQMDSEFVEGLEADDIPNCRFIKDTEFGKKLRFEYKFGLLHLLFQSAKKYVDDSFKLSPYPSDWKEEAKEVVASNDEFKDWFLGIFEFGTGDDFTIGKTKLKSILKSGGYEKIKFGDQVKKNRWTCKSTDNGNKWVGIREKTRDIEEL
jgi:hypothetical protein